MVNNSLSDKVDSITALVSNAIDVYSSKKWFYDRWLYAEHPDIAALQNILEKRGDSTAEHTLECLSALIITHTSTKDNNLEQVFKSISNELEKEELFRNYCLQVNEAIKKAEENKVENFSQILREIPSNPQLLVSFLILLQNKNYYNLPLKDYFSEVYAPSEFFRSMYSYYEWSCKNEKPDLCEKGLKEFVVRKYDFPFIWDSLNKYKTSYEDLPYILNVIFQNISNISHYVRLFNLVIFTLKCPKVFFAYDIIPFLVRIENCEGMSDIFYHMREALSFSPGKNSIQEQFFKLIVHNPSFIPGIKRLIEEHYVDKINAVSVLQADLPYICASLQTNPLDLSLKLGTNERVTDLEKKLEQANNIFSHYLLYRLYSENFSRIWTYYPSDVIAAKVAEYKAKNPTGSLWEKLIHELEEKSKIKQHLDKNMKQRLSIVNKCKFFPDVTIITQSFYEPPKSYSKNVHEPG